MSVHVTQSSPPSWTLCHRPDNAKLLLSVVHALEVERWRPMLTCTPPSMNIAAEPYGSRSTTSKREPWLRFAYLFIANVFNHLFRDHTIDRRLKDVDVNQGRKLLHDCHGIAFVGNDLLHI